MNHEDLHQLIRFIGALLFVLVLMGGLSLVLKRVNNIQPVKTPRRRRLAVIETLPIDGKRRLVLIRRDNKEHLLILGAEGETVIESGLESAQDESADDVVPVEIPSNPLSA